MAVGFRKRIELILTSDCSVGEAPVVTTYPCEMVGRCVHEGEGALDEARRLSFNNALRFAAPPKSEPRRVIKVGDVAFLFRTEDMSDTLWAHCGYISLNYFASVWLPLLLDTELTSQAPRRFFLNVTDGAQFLHVWYLTSFLDSTRFGSFNVLHCTARPPKFVHCGQIGWNYIDTLQLKVSVRRKLTHQQEHSGR